MKFDLDSYETVEARLERFWTEHPGGRIETRLQSGPYQLDEVVVWAAVWFDALSACPDATGHAFETRGGPGANATAHLENCETSALGRALANCGFKARKDAPRPSREEMQKVERGGQAQSQSTPTAGDCPDCGAPAGKPHASKCPRKGGTP
jgi:hypothetical protein